MNAWLLRFQTLVPRERKLVVGAALLFSATLLWLVAWRPAAGAYRELATQVENRRASLVVVRDAVAVLRAAGPARSAEPLLAVADRTARAAGFGEALQRLAQEDAGRVRVRLGGASFAAVVAWLADLQRQSGARIESLVIERGAASGLVDATITLAP